MATTRFPAEKRARFIELREAGYSTSRACRELAITPGTVRYALEHDSEGWGVTPDGLRGP